MIEELRDLRIEEFLTTDRQESIAKSLN